MNNQAATRVTAGGSVVQKKASAGWLRARDADRGRHVVGISTVRIVCSGMLHVGFVMRKFVTVVVIIIEGLAGRTKVGTTQV